MVSDNRAKREQLRVYEARQVLHAAKRARTRRDQFVWVAAALGAVVLSSVAVWGYSAFVSDRTYELPEASTSESREWSGEMQIGDVSMTITLDGAGAPQAVANFVSLAQGGFYDTTLCHRLTTDLLFVIQCGDPLGTGRGGPGYSFGPVENAPQDGTYRTGALAMARGANDGETHGSQFFIVYEDSEIPNDLAGGYTVFGQITSGLDELVETFVVPGTEDGSSDGPPALAPEIRSITIR